MDDLTESFTLSAATAIPLCPSPLPNSQSRRNGQSSTVDDDLKALPHEVYKSRKNYLKKLHKVKKGPPPVTFVSSNRRNSLLPCWLNMNASVKVGEPVNLLNSTLAMEKVATGVPRPISSFYGMEQGKPGNVVTTAATSKDQATVSALVSTLSSPAGSGHGFTPLPLFTPLHFRLDCCCEELLEISWSVEATITLIEAWGRRSIELNGGHFRPEDWQHVADAVNAVHANSEKRQRSRFQCRFRMDFTKRRYKKEKTHVTSSSNQTQKSSWPFFERMDALMTQADLQNLMQGLSIAPAQQVPAVSPVSSTPASQSGEDFNYLSLPIALHH